MLDLSSVRAKLARSAEHAQTIRSEIRAWAERNPYSIVKKRNADCTRFSLILRINEAPQLLQWSLIFGDYIHNLRSALDHLVYAIACHESAPSPAAHEDKLAFPICDSATKFTEAVTRKRLGTISDPVRAEIERFQPYKRPYEELPPLLSIIRDLNNGDKHKLIGLAYDTIYGGNIGFAGNQPPGSNIKPAASHFGEVEDGTEIFAVTSDMPAPDMDFDRHIVDVVIAVRHGKRDPKGPLWSDRTDIVALTTALSREVRQIIYDVSAKVE